MNTNTQRLACPTHGRELRGPLTRDEAGQRLRSHRAEQARCQSAKPATMTEYAREVWEEQNARCERMLIEYTARLQRGPACLCDWDALRSASALIARALDRLSEITKLINARNAEEQA